MEVIRAGVGPVLVTLGVRPLSFRSAVIHSPVLLCLVDLGPRSDSGRAKPAPRCSSFPSLRSCARSVSAPSRCSRRTNRWSSSSVDRITAPRVSCCGPVASTDIQGTGAELAVTDPLTGLPIIGSSCNLESGDQALRAATAQPLAWSARSRRLEADQRPPRPSRGYLAIRPGCRSACSVVPGYRYRRHASA